MTSLEVTFDHSISALRDEHSVAGNALAREISALRELLVQKENELAEHDAIVKKCNLVLLPTSSNVTRTE